MLLAVCLFAGNAYATDGDTYRDPYTSENSTGTWTFTNFNSAGLKTSVVVIDDATDTPSSVTAARTGYTWVLKPASGSVPGGVGYSLTLPTAADGLTFRFTTATNSTLRLQRALTSSDAIFYATPLSTAATASAITSPASTGSTVVLIGTTGGWYIGEMSAGAASGITGIWTTGSV